MKITTNLLIIGSISVLLGACGDAAKLPEQAGVGPDDTVAVIGMGPVGYFAAQAAGLNTDLIIERLVKKMAQPVQATAAGI